MATIQTYKHTRSFCNFFQLTAPGLWILSIILYLASCGCNKAESTIEIPPSFNRDNITTVIEYAKKRYIDPQRIDQNLSYVKAAQSAFVSLPYSLFLYSKEYYQKRSTWQKGKPLIPGRTLFLKKDDPYLIFIPNYKKWETISKKYKKERKKRHKKLSDAKRRKIFFSERAEEKKVREYRIKAWKKTSFSRKDFSRLLDWIEKNWQKYADAPEVYKDKPKYKDQSPFALNRVYFSATNGFLHSMDPHCSLLPQASWQKMLSESEDASFEGIGALLRGGGNLDVIVETPLPGSPALDAGLRAGDIIHKVDGKPIESMPLSSVVRRIRGPRQTVVILHVERPSELRNLDVSITRNVIKQLAVSDKLITDKERGPEITQGMKIGVIQIKSFLYTKRKTHQLVINSYKELLRKSNLKLDALVLDLRGNPGGYLEEGVAVADLFLDKNKEVVSIKGRQNRIRSLRTRKSPLIKGIPLVVLINSGSASASEILASALMDYEIALVLGERSFGKATVQSVEPSIEGSVVKLTSARYYAPKGYTVQVQGILPDIEVSGEADGSFPPRFREENMWDHLPRLEKHKRPSKRLKWVKKIKKFVGDNKKIEDYIKKHKNDALRLDYMLTRSIRYIQALKKYPKP